MRKLHPKVWNVIANSMLSIATVAVSVIAAPVAQARSAGQIRVEYETAHTPFYQAVSETLQQDQGFEAEAKGLSQALALPRDITVSFQECGIDVTSYDASASLIVMCYELLEGFRKDFVSSKTMAPENAPDRAIDAGKFVLLHEIGHALIHDWNLPVLGREEDAADQFATVLLSFGGGDRSRLAWAAALQLLVASEQQPDQSFVWDQHSSPLRRFQSIACLSYGSNPTEYSDLPETIVPASQRDQCVADFQQTSQSWGQLLRPHIRR